MPSITLSGLTATTPDGRALFSNLDLSFDGGRTGLVGRNGVGKTMLLEIIAGRLPPQAGTVSATGTLGVLRQTVQVAPSATVADLMGVTSALDVLRRAEQGRATADELASADWTLEARIASALGRIGLIAEPSTLLSTLSGGQRTRAALCALVLADPDFILLDEPTNNLDRAGRAAVVELLSAWRAGAIVVSHDRELLETMDAIAEMTSLGVTRYGGNWSHYRERKALELAAARHDLADAERRVAEVSRTAQATVERKARRDGAGQRKRARGDMPSILAGARQNRAESTSGDNARVAERRRTQAVEDAAAARQRLEVLQPLSMALPSTGLPAGKLVLHLDAVSAGYRTDRATIEGLSFTLTGPERVAITGPNGSGKTTLLALIAGKLAPRSGSVRVHTDFAMLDQEVSLLDPSLSIRDNFLRLTPRADENTCRAALARFMFRADAALQIVSTLSGGQMLRAGLACVLGGTRPPPLLILDEPTNHLDIQSIESVEGGLRAYDGALLVVSHDEPFLAAIGTTRRLALRAERDA
ncbi:ABC-F family ATP-binding cassette domain-containing protein [Reyranella sp.]|jgi:ATPase subunit of ABC transporter with duplicated ATPase domains|uniref:ABC-F family ATP-binding cassette domain-containing protein n=1 Tax=Reyranella sp. TaxID=1929291 RepID=UPI000BDC2556|nr:ABC-F family ATP-binding cassette domain-containing protein [Reyranella sp.]OYY40068.1 MAG: ABC transporter [Rhodospirillales bacterium 35-66-84]OYZ92477.1 MAG: ABC transporter [Rhodospirillales bacterium 24-66-33]OZB23785.1 MAG: ABC transporter [Rhodospirillales bacterium 39-66-50]HQS17044.1 ABC-F family ATP-binding cassette domain-containing protein [Reyranella sp.]HQT14985.1 ABC-F family ATP-binding cassette domain-containing protein [Reyranella sp.]